MGKFVRNPEAQSTATIQRREEAASDAARFLQTELAEHRSVFELTAGVIGDPFAAALSLLESCIAGGGKILLFGNGGSAADAQHLAAECAIRYKADRAPIAAIALTTDTSALTACGNDYGFEAVFARQVQALARPGDVVIGLSTSGNSPNVLAGLAEARRLGVGTMGMTGGTGGRMGEFCDVIIPVASQVTARIQEMHILIGHMLCKALEQRLGLV
jgi:D-sedoheptulose 7-phosphate isomerase